VLPAYGEEYRHVSEALPCCRGADALFLAEQASGNGLLQPLLVATESRSAEVSPNVPSALMVEVFGQVRAAGTCMNRQKAPGGVV
jgi:hypothetical protein